jgi:anti-anti-sigma factor
MVADAPLTVTAQGTTTLHVAGEVDHETAPLLRQAISELIDAGATRLHLDVSEVTFLDSAGLHAIAVACHHFGEHAVMVNGATGSVRRIFEISGMHPLLAGSGGHD